MEAKPVPALKLSLSIPGGTPIILIKASLNRVSTLCPAGPITASHWVRWGPAHICPKSIILIPARGKRCITGLLCCGFLDYSCLLHFRQFPAIISQQTTIYFCILLAQERSGALYLPGRARQLIGRSRVFAPAGYRMVYLNEKAAVRQLFIINKFLYRAYRR